MTLLKSNISYKTESVNASYDSEKQRSYQIALKLGVDVTEETSDNIPEILGIKSITNIGKLWIGLNKNGKNLIQFEPYSFQLETSESNLITRIRKNAIITSNVVGEKPQTTVFDSNSFYLLVQGALDITYDGEEPITLNAPSNGDWTSSVLSVNHSTDCKVEMHPNSLIFIVNLSNSASNYDLEYIRFSGEINKSRNSIS